MIVLLSSELCTKPVVAQEKVVQMTIELRRCMPEDMTIYQVPKPVWCPTKEFRSPLNVIFLSQLGQGPLLIFNYGFLRTGLTIILQ